MGLKIFAKRIAPFLVTFAAGLFIASFFVSIALPSFRFGNRNCRQQEMNRLQVENQELRENSCQMKRRLAEAERQNTSNNVDFEYSFEVPPPPPVPPAPPKAPVAPKAR